MTSTTREFHSPYRGPIAFDLDAPAAEVVVTVSPTAEKAYAELTGPDEIVNGTRPTLDDGRWGLVLPTPEATGNVIRHGNAVITNFGSGVVVTGDSMTFVNGRLVGGTNIRTISASEPVRLFVTLPAGSRLDVRQTAGTLAVRGALTEARISGTSADVDIETVGMLRARTISGSVTAELVTGRSAVNTVSGGIDITEADGDVTAQTVSGSISVGTASDISVDAESVSGNVTVRPRGAAQPDVRAHSVSGRVRTAR
jgi:hypothetical protein